MNAQDDILKPFEPKKKQSEELMANRNENRRKLVVIADQMSKFLRI